MPAFFRVTLVNPPGAHGNSAATHIGELDLFGGREYTDPSAPVGSKSIHTVEANDAVAAIQQVVRGTITVRLDTHRAEQPFTVADSSTNPADHKRYLIAPAQAAPPPGGPGGLPEAEPVVLPGGGGGPIDYDIRLEDMVGLIPGTEPDWDYNDRMWTVRVTPEVADPALPTVRLLGASGAVLGNGARVGKLETSFKYATTEAGEKIRLPDRPGHQTMLKTPEMVDGQLKDFIDLDADRFYAEVSDAKANTNPNQKDTVRAAIETIGEGAGNLRWVTLTETGANTGVFKSKSLLLVSNEQDDTYKVDGVVENAPVTDNDDEDRTFRVKTHLWGDATESANGKGFIADKVFARYRYSREGDPANAQRTVRAALGTLVGGTATKTGLVRLHVTILTMADGTAVISEDAVKDMIRAANEVYAQVGIHFQLSGAINTFPQPLSVKMEKQPDPDVGGIRLDNGPGALAYPELIPDSNEAGKVASTYRSADPDDIEVFFVNYLYDAQVGDSPRGIAAPAAFVPKVDGQPDPKYRDTVLLSAKGFPLKEAATKALLLTLAHEVGHVLTGAEHYETIPLWEVNLMRGNPMQQGDIHTASRRWTAAQQAALYDTYPHLVNRDYTANGNV